jgi:hypothetical protein
VLLPILVVPVRVPFKADPCHCRSLARLGRPDHTFVWLGTCCVPPRTPNSVRSRPSDPPSGEPTGRHRLKAVL